MSVKYYTINKPYGVLSQFTQEHGNECLKDYFDVPVDVYPVGRLDKDSEGLLILTNDKSLNSKILSPKNHISKTYFVQVDGAFTKEAIEALQIGVAIKVGKSMHQTRPAQVTLMDEPLLWERNPPVRFRKKIPTTWLSIVIEEGKNRQVRKMTAKVGFPTLRLVRAHIGSLGLDGLKSGELLEWKKADIYAKLNLK